MKHFQQNKKRRRPRKGKVSLKTCDELNEVNERIKYTLDICRLGRTRRKKYETRNQEVTPIYKQPNREPEKLLNFVVYYESIKLC